MQDTIPYQYKQIWHVQCIAKHITEI